MLFITDLAIILATAAISSFFFSRFKLPVFVGYLFTGIFVANTLDSITSYEHLKIWSEIGVIFLLFSIGLEFSLSDFLKLGTSPIKTGFFETVGTLIIVSLITYNFIGTSWTISLALATSFTISSTAIIAKSFNELKLKGNRFVQHVISILVFEDVAVIFIMLLIPTLALSQSLEGFYIIEKLLNILSFIVFSLILSILILPRLLHKIKELNTEFRLIFSTGLALTVGSLSHFVGLSYALGAFIAGSALAQFPRREEFLSNIEAIRNLFLAIFFVTTGMLLKIEKEFYNNLLPALGLSVIVTLAKFSTITLGSLLAKETLKNSIKSGLTMIAMGEFTLLLGQISFNLKLISEKHFQVIVLATFFNILLFTVVLKNLDNISSWIEQKIPWRLKEAIKAYRYPTDSPLNNLEIFKKFYLTRFLLYSLIILSLGFVSKKLIIYFNYNPFYEKFYLLLGLISSLPFFWGLLFYQPKFDPQLKQEVQDKLNRYQGVLFLIRLLIVIILFLVIGNLLLTWYMNLILLFLALFSLQLLHKQIGSLHHKIFEFFSQNLTPMPNNLSNQWDSKIKQQFWEAQLSELIAHANSSLIGKTLAEAKIRETYQILIAAIDRGGHRILGPSRYEKIYPFDRLFVIGSEEDILRFKEVIEPGEQTLTTEDVLDTFTLENIDVISSSCLNGKTIRESLLHNQGGSLVIAIEREGQKILNPDSSMQIKPHDRIWIVGEKKDIHKKIDQISQESINNSLNSPLSKETN